MFGCVLSGFILTSHIAERYSLLVVFIAVAAVTTALSGHFALFTLRIPLLSDVPESRACIWWRSCSSCTCYHEANQGLPPEQVSHVFIKWHNEWRSPEQSALPKGGSQWTLHILNSEMHFFTFIVFLKLEYILHFLSMFNSISQKAVIIILDSIIESYNW